MYETLEPCTWEKGMAQLFTMSSEPGRLSLIMHFSVIYYLCERTQLRPFHKAGITRWLGERLVSPAP